MEIPRLGERIYKQVTVDGKKINKWVRLVVIQKFDSNGNLIYQNNSGHECWMEYDSYNNRIHEKRDDGTERSWQRRYASNGKCIWFRRDWSGEEFWLDYDENGNQIHNKSSDGDELWLEYDENGNCIHEKKSDGNESWLERDENGNLIHVKNSEGYEGWLEYDENGNCIHEKTSEGREFWYEIDRHENGKKMVELTFIRM